MSELVFETYGAPALHFLDPGSSAFSMYHARGRCVAQWGRGGCDGGTAMPRSEYDDDDAQLWLMAAMHGTVFNIMFVAPALHFLDPRSSDFHMCHARARCVALWWS